MSRFSVRMAVHHFCQVQLSYIFRLLLTHLTLFSDVPWPDIDETLYEVRLQPIKFFAWAH
jgi:hypothetical protein